METLIPVLAGLHPVIPTVLALLGGLVVLGQVYVAITPTQDDDKWFAKLEASPVIGQVLRAVKAFAPVQRKESK